MMTRMRIVGAALMALTLAACSDTQLSITNPNSPTVAAAAGDPSALQLLATGLQSNFRAGRTSLISDLGIFGRESYNYFMTDGRATTHYLVGIASGSVMAIDPSGFASGNWSGQYNALRNIYNFKKTITDNTTLTAAQKSASIGFARTLEGQMLYELLMTRDSLGIIVEIKDNASDLAPFVSRDSAYKYVLATFDDAATKLAAGGSAFPFTLHSGFTGFNTPVTFATYTQALKARAAVNYAAITNSSSMYTTALTALSASYLNLGATTRATLDAGVYHIYSTASGDASNGLNVTTNLDLYAHMSIATDAEAGDLRYAAKVITGAARTPAGGIGLTSTLRFNIWATGSTPISSIRNEELIALHAEASLGAGNAAAAITDINILRQKSGGLAATTLTAASGTPAILTGILKEKRMSTLMEATRWVDMRKYGKLADLPIDVIPGSTVKHFMARVVPIPQGECLVRAGKVAPFAGPGC
ncbi:MAG: RagB/SusD family nutrient uptake outer membrane protein [Gemmatimonadetes bacterium]|nr:RagB/SusD family nutrient uptake outer membrane protein [Gemmatimonadota bacterium]